MPHDALGAGNAEDEHANVPDGGNQSHGTKEDVNPNGISIL